MTPEKRKAVTDALDAILVQMPRISKHDKHIFEMQCGLIRAAIEPEPEQPAKAAPKAAAKAPKAAKAKE